MDIMAAYKSIDVQREAMIAFWQALVNCDCGRDNKAGVDSIGAIIMKFFAPMEGITTRSIPSAHRGNMLIVEYGDMTKPFVVLLGHMDTVFADGTAAERPFTIKDGKAYGPGVLDMKGGITIAAYVLKTLWENKYDRYPIKLILAGDEESGHENNEAAKQMLMQESKGAMAAFNFETGFYDNGIVVERKGVFQAIFDIVGKGAHAGNAPQDGHSAIREMAYKILELEKLTDYETDMINVGVVKGGTVANAIPANASMMVDVRFVNQNSLRRIKDKFQEIADKVYVSGTVTHWRVHSEAAAMPRLPETMELFKKVKHILQVAGFAPISDKKVGGGSDSAYMVAAGVPTLCAFGVQGSNNHTVNEEADVESLFVRTKMMLVILNNI